MILTVAVLDKAIALGGLFLEVSGARLKDRSSLQQNISIFTIVIL